MAVYSLLHSWCKHLHIFMCFSTRSLNRVCFPCFPNQWSSCCLFWQRIDALQLQFIMFDSNLEVLCTFDGVFPPFFPRFKMTSFSVGCVFVVACFVLFVWSFSLFVPSRQYSSSKFPSFHPPPLVNASPFCPIFPWLCDFVANTANSEWSRVLCALFQTGRRKTRWWDRQRMQKVVWTEWGGKGIWYFKLTNKSGFGWMFTYNFVEGQNIINNI